MSRGNNLRTGCKRDCVGRVNRNVYPSMFDSQRRHTVHNRTSRVIPFDCEGLLSCAPRPRMVPNMHLLSYREGLGWSDEERSIEDPI